MQDNIFMPTLNGRGFLLPKQREIVLSEVTKPRFHKYPKFQRGSIGIFTGGLIIEEAGGGGTIPAVSNIEIHTTVSSGTGVAGIYFNESTLGSVEEISKRNVLVFAVMGNDDAGVPVDHTGEWTSDSVTAADWEVAYVTLTSGAFTSLFAALGVFTTFATADMGWFESRGGGKGYTPGTSTTVADFTIREVADTGNAATFTVTCICTQT